MTTQEIWDAIYKYCEECQSDRGTSLNTIAIKNNADAELWALWADAMRYRWLKERIDLKLTINREDAERVKCTFYCPVDGMFENMTYQQKLDAGINAGMEAERNELSTG